MTTDLAESDSAWRPTARERPSNDERNVVFVFTELKYGLRKMSSPRPLARPHRILAVCRCGRDILVPPILADPLRQDLCLRQKDDERRSNPEPRVRKAVAVWRQRRLCEPSGVSARLGPALIRDVTNH